MAFNERSPAFEGSKSDLAALGTATLITATLGATTTYYARIVAMAMSSAGHAWAIVQTVVLNSVTSTTVGVFNELGPAHSYSATPPSLTTTYSAGTFSVKVNNNFASGTTIDCVAWLYVEEIVQR